MVSVPRLRGLHSYIMLNENDVVLGQATVVLGPNDEQVLAKRLGKNIGPKAIKIQDPGGSYLKTRLTSTSKFCRGRGGSMPRSSRTSAQRP